MHPAKQRPTFECAHCKETFGFPVELDHKGVIVVTCPFCGKSSKVDLDPYRKRSTGLYREEAGKTVETSGAFVFPDTIPTESYDTGVDD